MVLKKIKRVKQGQNINSNHNNKRPLDKANTVVKMGEGGVQGKS